MCSIVSSFSFSIIKLDRERLKLIGSSMTEGSNIRDRAGRSRALGRRRSREVASMNGQSSPRCLRLDLDA